MSYLRNPQGLKPLDRDGLHQYGPDTAEPGTETFKGMLETTKSHRSCQGLQTPPISHLSIKAEAGVGVKSE